MRFREYFLLRRFLLAEKFLSAAHPADETCTIPTNSPEELVRHIQGKGLKHPVELQRDEPSSDVEC